MPFARSLSNGGMERPRLSGEDIIDIRGMLIDAISDDANAFYLALGLVVPPLAPMTLMVTLVDLRAAVTMSP